MNRPPIIFSAVPLLALALAFPLSCGGTDVSSPDEARPERWVDDRALNTAGFGTVSFVARDGHELEARIYRATGYQPADGPIWFVMHGADRDVGRYIRAAAPAAERYDALAIAVHFSASAYPRIEDYTLGIEEPGGWREPEQMIYSVIEGLFDLVRGTLSGSQDGYYLFGHSAGAQFTHRLLTFLPAPRVLGAVAANAGWYTLPAADDPVLHAMPYGLVNSPVNPDSVAGLLAAPLTILLGERDTSTAASDDLVRGSPEAEAQGPNRLTRGQNYFRVGETRAASLGSAFAWHLVTMPKAEHDAAQVMASAGFLTFVPDAAPCFASPSSAGSQLLITEILTDPPESNGDANGDGLRDPADDEFIEIVNLSNEAICLTGWALGDGASPERHLFPLGAGLAPGEVLLVFGGGVPTGSFAGAKVQWAYSGLSLQNAGDVITIRGADDAVTTQLSWGDCAGLPCAAEHWPSGLGVGASLTRSTNAGALWLLHPAVDGAAYSPGRLLPAVTAP